MTPRGRQSLAPRVSLFYFLDIITAMSGIMILIALYFSTCLREGSPLFPGSLRWQSPKPEQELESALLRLAEEKNRQAELQEKLRWADLSPSEIRRKLRRLQTVPTGAEGGDEAALRPLEDVLREVGLASLQDDLRSLERDLEKKRSEAAEARQIHGDLDRRVRLTQESVAGRLANQKGLRLVADGKDTTKVPIVVEVSDARVVFYPLDQPEAREVVEPGARAIRQLPRRFSAYQPDTHYAFLLVQPSGYGLFSELREGLVRLGFEVGYDGVPEDPRYFMPDVPTPAVREKSAESVIGEPEPWPVESGRAP